MTPLPAPEWAAVGAHVAEIRGGFHSTVGFTTVARHTATRVVLANGNWYRKQRGDRWTRSEGSWTSHSLMAADHEQVKAIHRAQDLARSKDCVNAAHDAWRRQPTDEAGLDLIEAVQHWQRTTQAVRA